MGSCEDPSEVLHEAALGQDSAQSHNPELSSCLKPRLELTRINAGPPEMQNGFRELLCDETAGCVNFACTERAAANNSDSLVGECANVAVPILEKVLDDECGASRGCLNEDRDEIGNCCLQKEGLCMENDGIRGKDGLVMSIETSATHLKRNSVQVKEKKDDNGVNGPYSKGFVEEKDDSLAMMESNTRDHVSAYCEKPVECQSMACSSHCPEQDCQEDDKLIGSTFTKRILRVIEEEHDGFVGTETLSCNQVVPSEGCEMPLESMFAAYSPKQHIQLDEQKCNQCIGSPHVEGFIRVSEERNGVLLSPDSLSCKPILPLEGADVSTTCLAIKSIQQVEQKDDEIIDCPYAEGAMEVKEVMIFNDQILPSHGCEILSESVPVTLLSKTCDEEHVLDARTFSGLDSNTDKTYQIKANSQNQISLPEGDEMPIKSLLGDLQSSGCHDNQKSETADSDPCTDRSIKGEEIKNSAETYVHVFSPQYEKSDGKNVAGPSVESNLELLEEKNDSKADNKVELCSLLSSIEHNAFTSEKGFFGMAVNGLLERSTSLQLTGCPSVVELSSFTNLEVKDCLRRSMLGSISAVGNSGPEDSREINVVKVDDVSENVSLSSPRTNRRRKSSKKSKGKKAAGKRRNAARVPYQHEILEYILKSPKRKRSHFRRFARCARWGSMDSITQLFVESNGLGLDYVLNQEPLKSLGGRRSGKRIKSRERGSSRRSSRKSSASSSVLRLKIKVGSENCLSNLKTVIPEVIDTSPSAGVNVNNSGSECCPGGGIEPLKSTNGTKNEWGEEVAEKQLFSVDKNLEDVKTELDVDPHGANSECTLVPDKLDRDGGNLGFASHVVVEALGGTIERSYADPGTSPDSEVTNIVPVAEVVKRQEEELNGSYCGAFACNKKGKKKGKLPYVGAEIIKTAKPLKNGGGKQKLGDHLSPSESLTSSTVGTASSISSSSRDMELLSLPGETDLEVPRENLEVKIYVQDEKCCDLDGHLVLSESENSQNILYSANSERGQPAKGSKPEGLSKERSKVSDPAEIRKGSVSRKRGSKQKSVNKGKVKEKKACDHAANGVEGYPESGKHIADAIGDNNDVSINSLDLASGGINEQSLPVDSAWVSCDDCHKWRRISDALVNSIDDSSPWSCKDNMDKAFADCSIPQEKSNAEINAELGISDADEDIYDSILNQKVSEYKHITASQEASFKRIDANEFLHRSRKKQTIDEIMVCHCKPPEDGLLGCGDQCLNRMLNIECVQGTCPCGDICSNQQFQKRQYAGMKWVRCGKKGFGLHLQEDISKGHFLIEYVGEVLDVQAYEARQREYAAKGHKHFYFMTLNGSEVIDACAKGNLGRFINHSCDPNCRTEKWMVNGEICIGLFALRDIKKGEEVTFDYNYVRVFGAAVKKCYCGSPQCRGYIGGDPHNAEIIVQGDSDEEFPEPVMLEDGKTGLHLKDMTRRTNSFDNDDMRFAKVPVLKSEMTMEGGDATNLSVSAPSLPHNSLDLEASKRKSPCSSQLVEVSPQTVAASKSTSHVKEATPPENTLGSVQVLEKSFSVDLDASRKPKSETVKGKRFFSKSRFLIKPSHSCGKKGKVNGNLANENKVQMIANKPQVLSVRPKKLVEGSSDGRFDAVEEKLNELLDANGGISKRKEAPKGYLKLLLLTAASGGSGNGEAIQSNRDLSMILDALLKTKSRVVLVDIINKNGLRMLHNIMKQYRRDFKKIPILRKLLKVLEYLATREILVFDHINGGPPCPGMESFRESMLSLTEHEDKQVHQIARNFRDRWIPKFARKANCLDRDDGGMEFHRGSSCGRVSVPHNHHRVDAVRSSKAIDSVMQSVPVATSGDASVHESSFAPSAGGLAKTRKRKSRWDQPAEPKTKLQPSISPNIGEMDHLEVVSREDGSCLEYIQSQCQQNEVICAANGGINSLDDVPPGFSPPLNPTLVSSTTLITPQSVSRLCCPLEVVVGHSRGKFNSCLPVSYGIPLPIVQQIGSPDNETLESWVIAPGMPFRPFPPLPPYPRDSKSTPESMATNEQAQVVQNDSLDNTRGYPHENNHGTILPRQSEANFQVANVQQTCKRARGSSYDLGKKYYRQQKWNKMPPWVRRSTEWGNAGNNLRGGTCSVDVGNMGNESRSPYCMQDVNSGVEKAGCYYNPHPHHHNQH